MGGIDAITLVLVGKTGNGKSATGNSILGRKAFQSKRSLSGVTSTSVMESTVLEDSHRQMINVIDTPGLFDSSVDNETIGKEIVSCIKMAMDGIHALLLVFSVRTRFSEEEKATISYLQYLFGEKICDYMIVVFTGADDLDEELEDGKNPLEEFISDSLESVKGNPLLISCLSGNRFVFFDNKTNDQTKKASQVQQLLSCVNMVLDKNGGEPFTNEIFIEMKKWSKKVEEQKEEIRVLKETKGFSEQELFVMMEKKRDDHLALIFEMVELKLTNMKLKFERDLSEELNARMRLEDDAKAARQKAEDDINRLKEERQKAEDDINRLKEKQQKAEDDINRLEGKCFIL